MRLEEGKGGRSLLVMISVQPHWTGMHMFVTELSSVVFNPSEVAGAHLGWCPICWHIFGIIGTAQKLA